MTAAISTTANERCCRIWACLPIRRRSSLCPKPVLSP